MAFRYRDIHLCADAGAVAWNGDCLLASIAYAGYIAYSDDGLLEGKGMEF